MVENNIEFIDCGSLSIQYDATGIASLSFVVIKNNMDDLDGTYTILTAGGVDFEGVIMSKIQTPLLGSGGWCQWQIQIRGVGNLE